MWLSYGIRNNILADKKQTWEMTYDELYQDWASRYAFGAKGELSVEEAQQIHEKWKRLGTQAKLGVF